MKRSLVVLLMVSTLVTVCLGDDWQGKRATAAFTLSMLLDEAKPTPESDECPDCYGTGKRGDGRVVFKCPTCNGTGKRHSAGAEEQPAEVATELPEPVADDPDIYGLRFTANWCQPCKRMETQELPKVAFQFTPIDVDEDKEATAKAGISEVPAFVFCDRLLQTTLTRRNGYQTAEELEAAIEEARAVRKKRTETNMTNIVPATVRIVIDFQQNGQRFRNNGSGTLIRNDKRQAWVLTCAHILPTGVNQASVELVKQGGEVFRADVVARDVTTDLAVLRFRHGRNDAIVVMGDVAGVTPVCVAAVVHGYPDGGEFSEIDGTTMDAETFDGVPMSMFDQTVKSGMSGGALTVDGTIVGVSSFRKVKEQASAFASVASIKAIKEKAGL